MLSHNYVSTRWRRRRRRRRRRRDESEICVYWLDWIEFLADEEALRVYLATWRRTISFLLVVNRAAASSNTTRKPEDEPEEAEGKKKWNQHTADSKLSSKSNRKKKKEWNEWRTPWTSLVTRRERVQRLFFFCFFFLCVLFFLEIILILLLFSDFCWFPSSYLFCLCFKVNGFIHFIHGWLQHWKNNVSSVTWCISYVPPSPSQPPLTWDPQPQFRGDLICSLAFVWSGASWKCGTVIDHFPFTMLNTIILFWSS